MKFEEIASVAGKGGLFKVLNPKTPKPQNPKTPMILFMVETAIESTNLEGWVR